MRFNGYMLFRWAKLTGQFSPEYSRNRHIGKVQSCAANHSLLRQTSGNRNQI
jgi:hypothetical protein